MLSDIYIAPGQGIYSEALCVNVEQQSIQANNKNKRPTLPN